MNFYPTTEGGIFVDLSEPLDPWAREGEQPPATSVPDKQVYRLRSTEKFGLALIRTRDADRPWTEADILSAAESAELGEMPGSHALEVSGLRARRAVLTGNDAVVDSFVTEGLGLWRGWQEAISTALLGNWPYIFYLFGQGLDLNQLKADARIIHRQLTPLWRRRANYQRVLLLDTPISTDGLTLYDLVAGSPCPEELALGAVPEDDRVATILSALSPRERRIALAWAHPAVVTWTEAALAAGADDPVSAGERVRRKLKRLGARHTARAQAAAVTRGGGQ